MHCFVFEQYVNTDMGASGFAKYLEDHGIYKIIDRTEKQKRYTEQEMIIILWSRRIVFWLMECISLLFRKSFGSLHR